MNFEIETREDDREPKKLAPPPDYSSPRVKARLLVLVGGLMLVLLLMNEARKPKNWLWMGFDSDGTQKETTNDDGFVYEEVKHAPRDTEEQDTSESDTEPAAPQTEDVQPMTDDIDPNSEMDDDSAVAQEEFWLLLYNQLELSERRTLFKHLRKLRNDDDAALTEACGKVVEKIEGMTQSHAAKLLGQMSLVDERNPLKEKMAQQFKAFNDQWALQLKPILIREQPIDAAGLKLLNQFQTVMDRAAFADILDNTPITRAADDPAWLRTWEDLKADIRIDEKAASVTPIQLKAQADFYRNQLVAMNGELRGIEVVATRNNPLGIEKFYSLWIKPERSAVQPYNVFVTELPAGLELSKNRFTPFEKVFVDVRGVFFKVRSYEDSSGAISETPLLLAKSFQVVSREEVVPIANEEVPVKNDWQPTQTTLIAFFVGMPLIAGLLAFFAYRSTTSKAYKPGKVVTGQIHENLDELTDDPTVQTVKERLEGLERNEG